MGGGVRQRPQHRTHRLKASPRPYHPATSRAAWGFRASSRSTPPAAPASALSIFCAETTPAAASPRINKPATTPPARRMRNLPRIISSNMTSSARRSPICLPRRWFPISAAASRSLVAAAASQRTLVNPLSELPQSGADGAPAHFAEATRAASAKGAPPTSSNTISL